MKCIRLFALCCVVLGANASRLRLTNNDIATLGEFPYQVSLQVDGRHICGGSLIGKKHVLTAAHCVHDLVVNRVDKSKIKIAVGTITVPGGTLMDVDRIAHHGAYRHSESNPTLQADVAVIRLRKEVTESENIKIIGLPQPMQELQAGQNLIVSGFGTNYLNGPTSPVLKKMRMYAVDRMTCQQSWLPMPLDSGLFCGTLSPGNGVCQGDSGGPLAIDKTTVIGIVSAVHSSGCGKGIPDLFTKVAYYMDFIKLEMARTS